MSCFEVQISPPSGTILEIETCSGQNSNNIVIEQDVSSPNLTISQCVGALSGDINNIIIEQINNHLVGGSGILLIPQTGQLTISATGFQPTGNYANSIHNHNISDIIGLSGILDNKQNVILNPVAGTGSSNHIAYWNSISGITYDDNQLYWDSSSNELGIGTNNPARNIDIVSSAGTSVGIKLNSTAVGGRSYSFFSTNNNSSLGGGKFGMYDDTAQSSRLVIDGNGNIGVGINSPSYKLEVVGTGNFTQNLLVNSIPVSVSGHIHNSNDITNFNSAVSGLLVPYALLNSPAFSGIPTVPTASSGTNTNQIASTSFVRNEISNLVDSAPSTLDTLNELAAALGDDPNFATTITNTLASKANLSGAIFTGSVTIPSGTANFNSLSVNGTSVSISGHTHTSSNITDFNSSVSGLLPSISGSGYVSSSFNNNIYTISVSGLQPSGNYSLVGHTHNISDIIDFDSSVIVYTTGNQTIDGVKTFTDNIFINDLLVSVKPIYEGMTLNLADTQLSGHRFKIINIDNYGDLNSYTITLPDDSLPGDCIILSFGTVISDITIRMRNHNGSGYGPMYTTMGFVRGAIFPINRSYIYYSDSDNSIPAGFYRAWINIPSSEHNHGNITDHGEIGSVSGLLVITSDNGLLTTTSGINSNYITNFESAVSGLIPPSNFTSLSGVSGIIVTNSGTNYFVGLNDPSIQLADITDLSANARTFLLTSSSNNLKTLISDETGSGVLVFNNSPAFSGIPTVPTAASGTNSNQIASTSFVRTEISNLVDSAPSTLDTLNELAAALGDDPNFATTVTNLIGNKVNKSGDTMTGTLIINPTGINGSGLVINDAAGVNLQNILTIDGDNFLRIYGQNGAVFSNEDNSLYKWTLTDSTIQNSVIGNLVPSSGYFTNLFVNNIPVSISGHTHNVEDIINFANEVSGLLPNTYDAAVPWTVNHTLVDGTRYLAGDLVYENGRLYKANYDNESIPVSSTLYWTDVGPGYRLNIDGRDIPNIPYPVTSVNGYSGIVELSTSDLDDFNSSVSGLIPVKNISGSGYVNVSSSSGNFTVSVTGLQPSGNYANTIHNHGNITSSGTIGSTIDQVLITDTDGVIIASDYAPKAMILYDPTNDWDIFYFLDTTPVWTTEAITNDVPEQFRDSINAAASIHSHGNISSSGAIGSTSGLLVITGNSGILTTTSGISSSYITNFNSAVSGLLPVKNIVGDSGISVSSVSGEYTIATTGNFGLTTEEVDDRVSQLLVAGTGVNLTYNDASGTLTIDNLHSEINVLSQEPQGFVNRTDSAVSFNDATRTFTIQPAVSGGSYTIYAEGVKVVKSGIETVVLGSGTALNYIHFDTTSPHTLHTKTTGFNFDTDIPIAFIHWNGDISQSTFFGEERHGIRMDSVTHKWIHNTFGMQYISGLSIGGYVLLGDGSSNSHAQIDISDGILYQEDIIINITDDNGTNSANEFVQPLSPIAYIPVYYHSGSTGQWVRDVATTFPLKYNATRAQYNLYSGGTWTTPNVPNNRYFAMWIVATNDINDPILAIMGQREDSSLTAAESNNNWSDINLTNIPTQELRPLYRLIFVTNDTFTNTPKSSLQSILDIRVAIQSTVGGVTQNDHGSLFGLADDDHPQYAHIDNNRTISAVHTFANGLVASGLISAASGNFTTLQVNGTGVSVSGHTHTSSSITDFNSSVSGLLPSVTGSGYVVSSFSGNTHTISVTGLQPSGNYSIVGHTHGSSDITDFNTAVSGLVNGVYQPLLTNPVTGTGIVNHIAYWDSSSGIAADSGQLVWDSTNNRLGIDISAPSGQLHVVGTGIFSARLGIGTTSPIAPLDVITGAKIGGASDVNPGSGSELVLSNTATAGMVFQHNSNNTVYIRSNPTNLRIGNNGGDAVTITHSNRNVGVGTSSPASALHVVGTSGIRVGDSSANSYIYGPSGNAHIHLNQSANNILLNSNTYASSSVSINTQTTNLNSASINVNGTLQFPKTGTATSTATQKDPNLVRFFHSFWNGTSAYDGYNDIRSIVSTTVNQQSRLGFLVNNGDGTQNLIERLSISSSGYIGINKTAPSYALDVVGTGNFSQNLLVNGTGVSLSGHTHTSSDITNFDAAVSGLLPTISNSGDNRLLTSTGSSIGINAENNLTFDGSTLNVDGNIVFDSFTESVVSIGNSSTSQTLSLASGTVQTCTLTNNCTFTMPTTTAGKSFTMFLNTGSGNYTASFSGVLWNDSAPPTITTTASKVDILSFISDGTYWYGSYSQNYG